MSATITEAAARSKAGSGTLYTVRDLGKGEHISVRSSALNDWCSEMGVSRWDEVTHAGFSDTLCLPELRAPQILERLSHAGFVIEK